MVFFQEGGHKSGCGYEYDDEVPRADQLHTNLRATIELSVK